ncbi:uncharacterized protein LOC144366978 [Ictidomys tridecemlineatus]
MAASGLAPRPPPGPPGSWRPPSDLAASHPRRRPAARSGGQGPLRAAAAEGAAAGAARPGRGSRARRRPRPRASRPPPPPPGRRRPQKPREKCAPLIGCRLAAPADRAFQIRAGAARGGRRRAGRAVGPTTGRERVGRRARARPRPAPAAAPAPPARGRCLFRGHGESGALTSRRPSRARPRRPAWARTAGARRQPAGVGGTSGLAGTWPSGLRASHGPGQSPASPSCAEAP